MREMGDGHIWKTIKEIIDDMNTLQNLKIAEVALFKEVTRKEKKF